MRQRHTHRTTTTHRDAIADSVHREHLPTSNLQPPQRAQAARRYFSSSAPVQMKAHDPQGGPLRALQETAKRGVSGAGGPLPHLSAIEAAFGRHDLSGVRAHIDTSAAEATTAMGAEAYTVGDAIAFHGQPSLHTAAHEAAHAVQQRAGVHLPDGVGQIGDLYERHADAVADAVVQGESAEGLLDQCAAPHVGAAVVQMKERSESSPRVDMYTWTHNGQTHQQCAETYRRQCDDLHQKLAASISHEVRVKALQARHLFDAFARWNNESPIISWCAEVAGGEKLPPARIIEVAEECAQTIAEVRGGGQEGLRTFCETVRWAEPMVNNAITRMNRYADSMGLGAERCINVLEVTKGAGMIAAGVVLAAVVAPVAATAAGTAGLTGATAAAAEGAIVSGVSSGGVAGLTNLADQYIEVETGAREVFSLKELSGEVLKKALVGAGAGAVAAKLAPYVADKLFPRIAERLVTTADASGAPVMELLTPEMLAGKLKGPLNGVFKKVLGQVANGVASAGNISVDWISDQVAAALVQHGVADSLTESGA